MLSNENRRVTDGPYKKTVHRSTIQRSGRSSKRVYGRRVRVGIEDEIK